MSKQSELLKTISLSSLRGGIISLYHIEEPYGSSSDPVVGIGVSLDGDANHPNGRCISLMGISVP